MKEEIMKKKKNQHKLKGKQHKKEEEQKWYRRNNNPRRAQLQNMQNDGLITECEAHLQTSILKKRFDIKT